MPLDWSGFTWKCDVCKRERPDAQISVHTVDISAAYHAPPGSSQCNLKYCNDTPECRRTACSAATLRDCLDIMNGNVPASA